MFPSAYPPVETEHDDNDRCQEAAASSIDQKNLHIYLLTKRQTSY